MQGSVATQLIHVEKHDNRFTANFLLNPYVKELVKSANICQRYEQTQTISLVFFNTECRKTSEETKSRLYLTFSKQ